ncbi:hypothetical protein MMC11_003399 [Xylographa trunciseda]|nr:hypothetical protein [Xylographa trunciseda]
MDEALAHLKSLASTADKTARKKLLDSLRDLELSLETPIDTINRIAYLPLQLVAARISIELNLFGILVKSDAPLSSGDIATRTGTDPVFISRLARYLASFRMIKEASEDRYTASNITRTLTNPGFECAIKHQFDSVNPIYQCLPSFLAANKYANIASSTDGPFQTAHHTPLPVFIWLQQQPDNLHWFNQWMAAQRDGLPTWLSVFPLEAQAAGLDPEGTLFVDVGGGIGHQCQLLKATHPTLPGRVILQDLPQTLAHALPIDGVVQQAHDFFTPQPVLGARFYYLRNILHDYPDERCRLVLQHLKAAMGKDSVILVDDMVLQDAGVDWQATQLDLTMMAAMGSMERTEKQWRALMEAAGLRIVAIHRYTEVLRDSVIAVVPA